MRFPIVFCLFVIAQQTLGWTTTKCDSTTLALYKATFEGLWTKAVFPKVYPLSRPKAEWSPLIGRSHSDSYRLFRKGELVNSRLQSFVEYGDTTLLSGEGQGSDHILDSFMTPPLNKGYGVSEARFFSDNTRSKISLAAKIIPSPDWFVGVDSVPLCENGRWVKLKRFDLWPLDAGSQRGYTFSSPRWRSKPQEVITQITSSYPNHTADAFYYPHLTSLPPIARVTVELSRLYTGLSTVLSTAANTEGKMAKLVASDDLHRMTNRTDTVARPSSVIKPPVPHFARHIPSQSASAISSQTVDKATKSPHKPDTGIGHFQVVAKAPTTASASGVWETRPLQHETTLNAQFRFDVPLIMIDATPATDQLTPSLRVLALLERIRNSKRTTIQAPIVEQERKTVELAQPREYGVESTDSDDEDDFQRNIEGSGVELDVTSTMTTPTTQPPHIILSEKPVLRTTTPTVNILSNRILPPDHRNGPVYEEKVCLVSAWSEWSKCSRTCGYGLKTRSRNITRWTGNIACPELRIEQLCGSMKKCNWNHFSLKFNSTSSILGNKRRLRPKKPSKLIKGGIIGAGRAGALTGNSGTLRSRMRKIKARKNLAADRRRV